MTSDYWKDNKKKLLNSMLFFVILIIATFFLLFKDSGIIQVFRSLKNVNLMYILLALVAGSIFIIAQGINILRNVNALGYNIGFLRGLTYSFVGFFFSGITPSASGGQPVQMYFMAKDKVKLSHSGLALLVELASFQFNIIFIALTSLILNSNFFINELGKLKYVFFTGITVNIIVFLFLIFALFSKKLAPNIVKLLIKILEKLKYKKVSTFSENINEQLKQYQEGSNYIKNNKPLIIKTLLTTFVELIALYSVTYFVYLALGLNSHSYFNILSIQSVLFCSTSAVPLPGGIGASEYGFMYLYKYIFPKNFTNVALVLTRGINFYFLIIVSGVWMLLSKIIKMNKAVCTNNKGI